MGLTGAALALHGWLASSAARGIDWAGLFPFAVAAILIGLFDVWLPQGDSADMSGPLVCTSSLLFGPAAGAAVVLLARAAALIAYRRPIRPFEMLEDMGRRLATVAIAAAVFAALGGAQASLRVPTLSTSLQVLAATGVFFVANSLLLQISASIRMAASFAALMAGSIRLLGWVTLAQVSVAALATLIHSAMGAWGLVIVSALLLVMRQSFALLIDIKDAYRSTVEVMARALEAHDPERSGHAERVTAHAGEVGRLVGLHGQMLEDLLHAALFHDVGVPNRGTETDRASGSAFVLRDVTLMKGALPILQVLDDAGATRESLPEYILTAAYIVARASEFDDEQRGRPHDNTSSTVGTRLYASTRRDIDRVMRRVESRMGTGAVMTMAAESGEVS